jgi:hypothetical protein
MQDDIKTSGGMVSNLPPSSSVHMDLHQPTQQMMTLIEVVLTTQQ